ncbi:DNA cytosine methyltransferase [Erythrobacter sp. SG61-1L]|uniref:DNA cytosine methyltransferase n=1 Tax=Erythrobacter sp. SG61-1L TaxID=1603897 RepID=UPI000ACAE7CC|nr:DNA cytosine methyltransferase [Erythrobacter sp. SG61-1L]
MGLIVDNFAGGGGASTGIEAALGRAVDIAINHDEQAIRMHEANHPGTVHIRNNIWQVDPRDVVRQAASSSGAVGENGLPPVDLAWFSPDCKHFSKAKGGKPRDKGIRDLAWVVVLWAKRVRPALILLENVEEFRTWGPLCEQGFPIKERAGETFEKWCKELRKLGYKLEFKELRACDYGAPTIRKRFFMVARCDGKPIVWPKPTHGKPDSADVQAGRLRPWRTAAEIIDWSIPCPSIFERKKPLAEKTLRRIAHGIMKFVVNNPKPFIVPLTHHGSDGRVYGLGDPLQTVTAAHRGEMAVVAPHITKFRAGAVGHGADEPLSTVATTGSQQRVVTSNLMKLRGTRDSHIRSSAESVEEPLSTISAEGTHMAEVRAFLIKYYGNEQDGHGLSNPLGTVTVRDRFGLVTVTIEGEEYVIVDIGMRMLTPRELFNAQGFPPDYIIDVDATARPITKTAQVAKCGNSVCPPLAEALARANWHEAVEAERADAQAA